MTRSRRRQSEVARRRSVGSGPAFGLRIGLGLALAAMLLPASSAVAQLDFDQPSLEELEMLEKLSTGDLADLPTERFDEQLWADAAHFALRSAQYIRARELTEQILEANPQSFKGHTLLGVVFHLGEANLPRALFHLERSRGLFEREFTAAPSEQAPWRWHSLILAELAAVSGEMGRHADKVDYLLEHDALYQPARPAERGWPLMRLRRYDEARRAVEEALTLKDQPDQVSHALTALCAIEAEQQDRRAGYEACLAAVDHERAETSPGPTPFTNGAEASLGMLFFDEAEQLILEASRHFVYGTVSNPYLDLTHLYLAQGRIAEGLDSVRSMFKWRNRQPPFMDDQNRAETELASAIFLLVAGHALEARDITRRVMERPDRTGFTSSESEQMEAAAALVDALVQRTASELLMEEAACSTLWPATQATATAWRWRLQAWASTRRAASLLAEERFLLSSLRPYLAGSIELPEWLKIELVAAVGGGVAGAALDTAESRETLEAGGYFLASRAEISCLGGSHRRCLEDVDRALEKLPGSEVLLRARLIARGAHAADRRGERQRALELFDRALQMDPGVIRRLGLSLPVRITSSGDGAMRAAARAGAKALGQSPRFRESRGETFKIDIQAQGEMAAAALLGPNGTRLADARVRRRAGESPADLGRRLARELHGSAFSPRLDLTQADLSSLDGSPTAADARSHERLRTVIDDVIQGTDR